MQTPGARTGIGRPMVAAGPARRRSRPGDESTEWPVLAPPVGLAAGPLGAVQAADREIARHSAARARAVAAFAATRPSSADRPQGTPGAMSPARWAARPQALREVSEWAAAELAVALSIGAPAAEALLERSLSLVHRLPGTLAALEAAALHPGHVWPLLDLVAPIADDRVRAQVEAGLLRWLAERAAKHTITTPAQLRDRARREVLRRDAAAAADRLRRALTERGVYPRGERTPGMGGLLAVLTQPEARALYQALGAYADALPDDPDQPRSRGQKMADCLLDLVLRPGECDLPPVRVLLTLVAPLATALGGDTPAELDGDPVPAELARALLRALTGRPPLPAGPPGATDTASAATQQAAEEADLEDWWAEMERRLLADQLPDRPDPVPEGVLASWAAQTLADAGRLVDGHLLDHDPLADDLLDSDLLAAEDLLDEDPSDDEEWPVADEPGDPGPPPEGSPPEPAATTGPPPSAPSPGGGWWATADRAVDDAADALRRAEQVLGHARRSVATAARAAADDEAAWQVGRGRVDMATDALAALAAAGDSAREQLAALLAATAGGGLADRPRLALTDALTGALLTLTDWPTLSATAHCGSPACRRTPGTCIHELTGRPGLGPPGPTDAYRPATGLDRYIRARDRRCRFPGCRRRIPKAGELDHHTPYPDGPTDAANLAGYCTQNHRLKHQAPGWTHHLGPDATLTVTTPTGLTVTTEPPSY